MLKTLERNLSSVDSRIVLVAPSEHSVSSFFDNVQVDTESYDSIIGDIQRFRGRIYLQDGAVQREQLTADGRHETPEDDKAWHMLLVNSEQKLSACALYHEHKNTIEPQDLRVRHCPLATHSDWAPTLWKAVTGEIARARREQLEFAELGGWAVAPEVRRTSGPLTMALAVYGFSRRHGGALGMTTATFRHCSAVILQRLGGSRFEVDGTTLPPYYDPRYECMMEMLRFDSRFPNPKYLGLIDQLRDKLSQVRVVTRPAVTLAANSFQAFQTGQALPRPRPMFAA
jgi:hypothetical protein